MTTNSFTSGFETADAQRLRDYLASRGVDVPAKVGEDECGNLSFQVKDPSGHMVEFVQYLPDSIQGRNSGNMMPDTRLSGHILHVGMHVPDVPKANSFWVDILGFRLLWEGGSQSNPKAWVSMVPNGSEWLEYMTSSNPSPKALGDMNHVALEVMDIQKPWTACGDAWVYAGQAGGRAGWPLVGQLLRSRRLAHGIYDSQAGREAMLLGFTRSVYLEMKSCDV